jgi:GNAT superfamily N-acetyltransferase
MIKRYKNNPTHQQIYKDFELLFFNSFSGYDRGPIEDYIRGVEKKETAIYILYKEDIPIGYYTIDICKRQFIILHHLFVLPEYRKLGLGTKLLNRVKKLGTKLKLSVLLESENNMLNYYFKNGFKKFDFDYYAMDFGDNVEGILYNLLYYRDVKLNDKRIVTFYKRVYNIGRKSAIVQKTLSSFNCIVS